MKNKIEQYKSLEREAHVSLSDIVNKATQEVAELVEAIISYNKEEMHKEAGDAIVNITSATHEVGGEINYDRIGYYDGEYGNSLFGKMLVCLGEWNSEIQAIRGRYSRDTGSVKQVTKKANELIKMILSFVERNKKISEIFDVNIAKFEKRNKDYKLNIDIKDYIDEYENFPKEGIVFKDIKRILKNPEVFRYVCFELAKNLGEADYIVGLDARGFLFGSEVAQILNKPFVMIRKKGKLPGIKREAAYDLEYGSNDIEIQKNVISKGAKVAIIDDLLATGGTMFAATKLIEEEGGIIDSVNFVISLDEKGLINTNERKALESYKINSLCPFK